MSRNILPFKNQSIKICSIEGCGSSSRVRKGLCSKHRYRLLRYGQVDIVRGCQGETPEVRFWGKVAVTANPEKCWEWQKSLNSNGYGQLTFKGKLYKAHRVAWWITYGSLPKQMLLHSCDNKKCVNPNHLSEGTNKQNSIEAMERGLILVGEKSPNAKLTSQDVIEIRRRIQNGEQLKKIAEHFPVTSGTLSEIKRGLIWKQL